MPPQTNFLVGGTAVGFEGGPSNAVGGFGSTTEYTLFKAVGSNGGDGGGFGGGGTPVIWSADAAGGAEIGALAAGDVGGGSLNPGGRRKRQTQAAEQAADASGRG